MPGPREAVNRQTLNQASVPVVHHPLFGLQITQYSACSRCARFFSVATSRAVLLCSPQGTLGFSADGLAVQRHRDDREVPEASGVLLGSRLPPPLLSLLFFS